MSTVEDRIAELLKEIQTARTDLAKGDDARMAALAELRADVEKGSKSVGEVTAKIDRISADMAAQATRAQTLEAAIETLSKKVGRPGGPEFSDEVNRKAALGLLELRHLARVPKRDAEHPFKPTEEQIAEAATAIKGVRGLLKTTDIGNLPEDCRKALTSFNLGSSGFILPPEMSSRVLSCLEDITDVAGLMQNITISGPSIKFMVDDARLMEAAWACQTDCFANNPAGDLTRGLGELELRPETLRFIVCTSRDILEDASVDMETWMLGKVNWAFRNTISTAIISGDGIGKPIGILNPASGIPICDVSASTPAGQFTWQDLVMLKWMVPMQFHGGGGAGGGRYLMNQNTFGLVLTMSDAMGRPIMIATPTEAGVFTIAGSPVQIVTQMPDVAPGSTPVAFGNWNIAYMVVNRRAVTMQQDPYSAGFCVLYKFEARVGGGIICANAARLMRIR